MKQQYKIILSALTIGIFIFMGVSSGEESDIHSASTYEEAKEEVDNLYYQYKDEYSELCDGPRNGQNKEKFAELGDKIRNLENCGEGCEKLDGEIQLEVSNYARNKISSNNNFTSLAHEGMINCW